MLQPGDSIERYTVDAAIGSGAMGTVYRVTHTTLGVPMALKVLHGSRAQADRLVAEGRVQASLRHPGIVSVADLLDLDGTPALVMELVDGLPLDAWVRAERPDLDRRIRVFRLLVEAVAHAHDKGVVHRDLKPGNVLVDREGERPRITDFGVAALLGDGLNPKAAGSPAYMAPEQFRPGARVDVRADLWSLGVVLYELCCDQRPFAGADLPALQQAMSSGDYVRPSGLRSDLPAGAVAVVEACLSPDPAARPASCAALLELLDVDRPTEADPVETWEGATFEVDDRSEPPEGGALAPRPQSALVAPSDSENLWAASRAAVRPALAVAGVAAAFQFLKLLAGATLASVALSAAGNAAAVGAMIWGITLATQLYTQRTAAAEPVVVQPGSLRDRWRQVPRGLRIFVGAGAPFGGMMALFGTGALLLKGTSLSVGALLALTVGTGALGGVLFGAAMAVALGLQQVWGHSDGGARAGTRMSCEQQFSAVIGGDPDEVYAEAEQLVAGLGIARVLEADPERRSLAVVTRLTQSEGGSVVDVRVERDGAVTVAKVASRPALPTQLVDGGSNKRIVDGIVDGLLERFPVEL